MEFIKSYIEKTKKIQEKLLEFLENDSNNEIIQDFQKLLNDEKIMQDSKYFQSVLYLIDKISNNHARTSNFISKIEQILSLNQNTIKNNFSSYEIFDIFKDNKLLLRFLFESKIIIPDKSLSIIINKEQFKNKNYPQYFFNEFKSFFNPKLIEEIKSKNPEIESSQSIYDEKRKIGENDHKICELIRNDSIKEFAIYISQNNFDLQSHVVPSIYETNSLLLKKEVSLIEYAAFFGSVKIFNFLQKKILRLNQNIWTYAVHSKNRQIIQILEDLQLSFNEENYKKICKESVKCHHIDLLNYFKNNFLTETIDDQNMLFYIQKDFEFYNFIDFFNAGYSSDDVNIEKMLYIFVETNNTYIVDFLLKQSKSDDKIKEIVNKIHNYLFFK